MKKQVFSIIGKPNSGKGTLVRDICSYYKSKHDIAIVSASDTINRVNRDSALWKGIQALFARGELIPHDTMNELLANEISRINSDIICLDGAISILAQGNIFDSTSIIPVNGLVVLSASDELCVERARKRIVCDTCRDPYRAEQVVVNERGGAFVVSVGSECLKCGGKFIKRADESNMPKRLVEFHEFAARALLRYVDCKNTLSIEILPETTPSAVRKRVTDFLSEEFGL